MQYFGDLVIHKESKLYMKKACKCAVDNKVARVAEIFLKLLWKWMLGISERNNISSKNCCAFKWQLCWIDLFTFVFDGYFIQKEELRINSTLVTLEN